MPKRQMAESRESLSARYWDEFLQLIEHGEMSVNVARSRMDDMFENAPGQKPMLRERYWQSYLREMAGDFVGRAEDPMTLWPTGIKGSRS